MADRSIKHILKVIKRGYTIPSDTTKREPIKLINKPNGRPKPVVQKAGYTMTKRVFRNGGKAN